MLKIFCSVHINLTFLITSNHHRVLLTETNNCLWCIVNHLFLLWTRFVKVCDERLQWIQLDIPNLNSSIVCDWGKDCRCDWRPGNVIDLSLNLNTIWLLLADELSVIFLWVPYSNCPIIWASEENWTILRMPERITSYPVNWTLMPIIVHHWLIWIGSLTIVNTTVFSCSEVCNTITSSWEINTKTTSINECHSSFLVFIINSCTAKWIFLAGVCLPLKLGKVTELKAFSHWPLNDTTITTYWNESFTFGFSINPLNFPNNISMLSIKIHTISDWFAISRSNVKDGNITLWITNSNEIWVFLGELTTCDRIVMMDEKLRESWIL